MTRTTKRFLFYSALIAFLGISYVAILYAQGYKYNFEENEFFKTGAFYVKANIGAAIYIDGELAGQTSFLGNSFSKDGLLPGQYLVRVEKENYSVWQKNITIEEGLVTEFPRFLILPQSGEEKDKVIAEIDQIFAEIASASLSPTPAKTPTKTKTSLVSPSNSPLKNSPSATPNINEEPFYINNKNLYQRLEKEDILLAVNVNGFVLSENRKKLVWWTSNELWVMWLDNTGYQPFMQKGDRGFLVRFSSPIKKAAWFDGSDHLVADIGSYKIIETDARGGVNVITL